MLKIYQRVNLRTLSEINLHTSTSTTTTGSVDFIGAHSVRSAAPISPYCSLSFGNRITTKNELKKLGMAHNACDVGAVSQARTSLQKKYSTESSSNGNGMAQLINVERELQKWKDGVCLDGFPEEHKAVHAAHLKAVEKGLSAYNDPITGFEVFTILSHLRRGYCCGNTCRHCPFKHSGVSQQFKQLKKFNTAFYA
ncbi:hypothetical protein CAPTEDRAFT_228505 [Capitella teleta]|uniref:Uncharacterized protein n=1 Tax=Capitella teleta TaxID=283909 RepID=R7VB15_CAPTE|nr:hypothetical protein CAPTEDRAFT_228505 [Capitella teleta]|eukprot:ELU15804.1 hypothetical protein CAPTEDRAFT_228505 [Capitella teleta]